MCCKRIRDPCLLAINHFSPQQHILGCFFDCINSTSCVCSLLKQGTDEVPLCAVDYAGFLSQANIWDKVWKPFGGVRCAGMSRTLLSPSLCALGPVLHVVRNSIFNQGSAFFKAWSARTHYIPGQTKPLPKYVPRTFSTPNLWGGRNLLG